MAGSRAADAREPGQIREEAALSDTVRAPRISLAGADDWRARPRTSFDEGCTVHFSMSDEPSLELIRRLAELWNAGEPEAVLALYHEDAQVHASSAWPENDIRQGRDDMRLWVHDWLGVWEESRVELSDFQAVDDKVVVRGVWTTRGRASGAASRMPFSAVFTVRDGKIAVHEWFDDYDSAVAAARSA